MKKQCVAGLVALSMFLPTYADALSVHTVARGETLWGISNQENVSVDRLKSLNNLKSNIIYIGQQLKLDEEVPTKPNDNSSYYLLYSVKSNETLWSIATDHGVTAQQLIEWNGLKSNTVYIGQRLNIKKSEINGDTSPVVVPPTESQSKIHTVVKGDTLWGISRLYGVSLVNIRTWNNLKTDTLNIGQKVQVGDVEEVEKAVVVADWLNVRSSASTSAGVLDTIKDGTIVTIEKTSGIWKYISYDQKTGWVHGDYISKITDDVAPSIPNGKIIVLDPGHGGFDVGAKGVDGTTYEHTINWQIASKVYSELVSRGYTVKSTRGEKTSCGPTTTTEDLKCRVEVASDVNGAIMVSIHSNWFPGARGTETYYNAKSTVDYPDMNPYPSESKRLAEILHKKVVGAFNSYDRGVMNKSYYVNRMADIPSVLLEIGYLSDSSDLTKLKSPSYQSQVAKGIAEGIDSFFGN